MLPTPFTATAKPLSYQTTPLPKQNIYALPTGKKNFFLEDSICGQNYFNPKPKNDCGHSSKRSIDSSTDQTCDSLNNSGLIKIQTRSKLNYFSSKFSKENDKRASQSEYTKKFKTELCKNFQLKGCCLWGDTVG